jgi:hypothetical protein
MAEFAGDIFEHLSGSFGNKKWISATAVADYGNSQAIAVAPTRRSFTKFQIAGGMLTNRSGGDAMLGIGVRYRVSTWEAGQVTAAGVYAANTTAAQDATTDDFGLHDRTDDGSGFLVGADERFNTIGIVQSAAGDQTTPTQLVEYWDGTSWVDLDAAAFLSDDLDGNGTGEKIICFPMPMNWVVGGSGTGVPSTRYNLRVRQTIGGAGSADPVADQLFVGFTDICIDVVSFLGTVSLLRDNPLRFPRSGDALFPLCSVASLANYFSLDFQLYA